MPLNFNIYRRLEDGQVLLVASRREACEAENLVTELNQHWPGEYGIQQEDGTELMARQHACRIHHDLQVGRGS